MAATADMTFDLDPKTRRALGYRLIDWVNEYFSSLPERSVQPPAEERRLRTISNAMPEVAGDAEAVLDEFCREVTEQGFHIPAANYFGLMNPAPTYMAVLAEAMVAALNPQLASLARSQTASRIEAETLRWIGNRVGWTGSFNGTFTTGGAEANLSGLALALAWRFPGVVEYGLASLGAQPVFYASGEAHHSLDKAAGLLGIGRRGMRRIAVDGAMRLDPGRVERAIQEDVAAGHRPFAIAATAGTTNSGAIDDLPALAEIARRHQLWFHVDAAYGGALMFSQRYRELVRGLEMADSIAFDPHKWLSMPFSCGVVLTSRPEMLQPTFAVVTPYMPLAADTELIDNFKISAQWSRRMNSLKLWLTLRVHGRQAYEEHIERQMRLAACFAEWLRNSPVFELSAPQVLPVVNFRVKRGGGSEADVEAANAAVVDAINAGGKYWISETHVAGRSAIRMMIISYFTEERHLRGLQEALAAIQI